MSNYPAVYKAVRISSTSTSYSIKRRTPLNRLTKVSLLEMGSTNQPVRTVKWGLLWLCSFVESWQNNRDDVGRADKFIIKRCWLCYRTCAVQALYKSFAKDKCKCSSLFHNLSNIYRLKYSLHWKRVLQRSLIVVKCRSSVTPRNRAELGSLCNINNDHKNRMDNVDFAVGVLYV